MATKKSNGTSITSLFENIEEKGFGELGAEDLARLRRVGRRAKLGEDVRRRTRGQHLHDGGHERARRRARDTPPTRRAPPRSRRAARGNESSAPRVVIGCSSGRAPRARLESCQPRTRRPPPRQPSSLDRSRARCRGEHCQQWTFSSMVDTGSSNRTRSEA